MAEEDSASSYTYLEEEITSKTHEDTTSKTLEDIPSKTQDEKCEEEADKKLFEAKERNDVSLPIVSIVSEPEESIVWTLDVPCGKKRIAVVNDALSKFISENNFMKRYLVAKGHSAKEKIVLELLVEILKRGYVEKFNNIEGEARERLDYKKITTDKDTLLRFKRIFRNGKYYEKRKLASNEENEDHEDVLRNDPDSLEIQPINRRIKKQKRTTSSNDNEEVEEKNEEKSLHGDGRKAKEEIMISNIAKEDSNVNDQQQADEDICESNEEKMLSNTSKKVSKVEDQQQLGLPSDCGIIRGELDKALDEILDSAVCRESSKTIVETLEKSDKPTKTLLLISLLEEKEYLPSDYNDMLNHNYERCFKVPPRPWFHKSFMSKLEKSKGTFVYSIRAKDFSFKTSNTIDEKHTLVRDKMVQQLKGTSKVAEGNFVGDCVIDMYMLITERYVTSYLISVYIHSYFLILFVY